MASFCIHYFSGTGNSERAAQLIAEALTKAGKRVTLRNIAKDPVAPAEHFDLQLFIYPTYSWAAPVMVKRYLRGMPKSVGVKAAVLQIFGGSADYDGNAGQGVREASRLLKRRGFDVVLSEGIAYPSNWVQFSNPPKSESCDAARSRSDKKLAAFAGKILRGDRSFYSESAVSYVLTALSAFFFGIAGRKLLGKMFVADDSCTKCGLCAKSCPAHTISMKGTNGKPYWGATCENCNRCMNLCPSKSIQTSVPAMIFHFACQIAAVIVSVKIASFSASAFDLPAGASLVAGIVIFTVSLVVLFNMQLYLIDGALGFLRRIPAVDRFFAITFTRSFRRYTAPGFKP